MTVSSDHWKIMCYKTENTVNYKLQWGRFQSQSWEVHCGRWWPYLQYLCELKWACWENQTKSSKFCILVNSRFFFFFFWSLLEPLSRTSGRFAPPEMCHANPKWQLSFCSGELLSKTCSLFHTSFSLDVGFIFWISIIHSPFTWRS